MSPIHDYFTDADPSISGSLHSDPMGLEVVWTGYATNIFATRVNSVSNDLRAYTINLFHHWIVYQIRAQSSPSWWKPAARARFQCGEHPGFSRELLVLLEKFLLIAFARRTSPGQEGLLGLIGLSNARNRLGASKDIFRYRLHRTDGEIVARQTQLGFSGRYRTAFTAYLKLLDPITGHPVDNPQEWELIRALFNRKPYRALAESILVTVRGLLERGRDVCTSDDLAPGLEEGYVEAFATRDRLERDFGAFWKESLKLHTGHSRWLWAALAALPPTERVVPRNLYLEALALGQASGDVDGIVELGRICAIEPMLSRVSFLFEGLRQTGLGRLDQAVYWVTQQFGSHPLAALAPPDTADLIKALKGEGHIRVERLLAMVFLDAESLVLGILDHHEKVSVYRDVARWVELRDGRLHRRMPLAPGTLEPDSPLAWRHPYYATPFADLGRAIMRGAGT
jgi:hypothetical protein